MAINFNRSKHSEPDIIKDIAGFTFITGNKTEGIGFVTKNDHIVITIMAVYDTGAVDTFSIIVNEYGEINPYSSIKDVLTKYCDYDMKFIKTYKKFSDMNIIIDLEVE